MYNIEVLTRKAHYYIGSLNRRYFYQNGYFNAFPPTYNLALNSVYSQKLQSYKVN